MSGNQRAVATEPSFPRRRESRPVRTETYRLKGFSRFRILDSRLRGNDGFRDYGVVGRVSRLRCCRNATEPSFPRKWESRTRGLGNRFIR
ncbi:hypothetical protein DIP04_09590 [Neisseria gonorrhoeae]